MKNPRLCARCGAEIRDPTQDIKLCDSCRLEAKRASAIKERTCRSCGASFSGGPRAWYCPDCRRDRAKESKARIRRTGPAGSSGEKRTVRPHSRRGHWHHFWRNRPDKPDEKELILRWVAPTFIHPDGGDDKPTVVKAKK